MNVCVQIFAWTCFQFSRVKWLREEKKLLGLDIVTSQVYVYFFEELPSCFPQSLHQLNHDQPVRVPIAPISLPSLVDTWRLITAIIVIVKWYSIVVSIHIFPVTNDVGHFFICLMIICLWCIQEITIQVLLFQNRSVCFFSCWVIYSWYILDIRLLLDLWFANIFSYSMICPFIYSIMFFNGQKSLIL